jgi:hypothetical protein
VAKKTNLYAVKVLGSDGSGTTYVDEPMLENSTNGACADRA